jgi:hypothetical protein
MYKKVHYLIEWNLTSENIFVQIDEIFIDEKWICPLLYYIKSEI